MPPLANRSDSWPPSLPFSHTHFVRSSKPTLHTDTRATNSLIRTVRAPGERTTTELEHPWRPLHHVTLSPTRTGAITRTAHALNRHGT